ncbi:hypothetical protein PsorP6_011600 [Peronosclerospora sorghi]|uniref:Uncharacterized protein n=1 Tax=Peronosclerospora sorghi TaxID=230839 RepID=A0ACC0WIY4_9STRA|nr:hypothetical protein PsorP6_011600 [Peronosclerospora sorghi]
MRIITGLVHYLALIGSSKGVFHVSHLLFVSNKFCSRHYWRFSCLPRMLSSVSSFVRSIISSDPALTGHFDTDLHEHHSAMPPSILFLRYKHDVRSAMPPPFLFLWYKHDNNSTCRNSYCFCGASTAITLHAATILVFGLQE